MASEWYQQEARARFLLGVVLVEIAEDEYAIELFRCALERDPTMVAAYVHLGLAYGRLRTYQAMLGAFREAVQIDPLSVRTSVVKEPEEVPLIARLLNPPSSVPASETLKTVMPAEYVEAGNLVRTGKDLIAVGRDEKAIEALERSLRIDLEFPLAISLLSLAYLLHRTTRRALPVDAKASVLFEIDATLAKLIFND
jgi:tetratricopeptide (TPR) repeat protein